MDSPLPRGAYVAFLLVKLSFLESIPVYSEARFNKPVDCVSLCVSGAWCIIAFKRIAFPSADTPCPCGAWWWCHWWIQSLRSRRALVRGSPRVRANYLTTSALFSFACAQHAPPKKVRAQPRSEDQ